MARKAFQRRSSSGEPASIAAKAARASSSISGCSFAWRPKSTYIALSFASVKAFSESSSSGRPERRAITISLPNCVPQSPRWLMPTAFQPAAR